MQLTIPDSMHGYMRLDPGVQPFYALMEFGLIRLGYVYPAGHQQTLVGYKRLAMNARDAAQGQAPLTEP